MSLRICVLHLKTLKKSYILPFINSFFKSQYHISSVANKIQNLASQKIENIQYPKHVQPIINHSVEEILSSLQSKFISENESVSILKALRMLMLFKNENSDNFKNDERFQILCKIFARNCNRMHPNLLISGLRSLLEIGIPSDSECVIAAEKSIIDNIQIFSFFNLVGCLYYHHKFTDTNLQKDVVSLLIKELCKRLPEMATSAEVLMLTHFLHIFNEEEQKSLENKLVELLTTLNIHEICKIFTVLAENSNRNVKILNSLVLHLHQKEELLQMKDILDILYSMKKLNFINIHIISKLMSQIMMQILSVKQPSVISSILTVCGHLRLRHTGTLNACANWIVSHKEMCGSKEFVSFVLTVATLNYHNPDVQNALHTILPLITFENVNSSDVWLDYVWSLAVLNIIDKEILLTVLSPNFYKPLIDNSGFNVIMNKLKLMNLKTVLKNCYPECVFGCNLFLDPVEIPQSLEIQNNRKHVLNVLKNFVPGDKYLCMNQSTDMGIFIDAEFIMDKNLKPLPLSQFGILSKVTNTKVVPVGAQRIALLVLFYKDFTLCSISRIGFQDLTIRLLFSQGYTPVPISFAEFMRNKTEVKKAKYLLQKISSIMKNVEDNKYKFDINLFN